MSLVKRCGIMKIRVVEEMAAIEMCNTGTPEGSSNITYC